MLGCLTWALNIILFSPVGFSHVEKLVSFSYVEIFCCKISRVEVCDSSSGWGGEPISRSITWIIPPASHTTANPQGSTQRNREIQLCIALNIYSGDFSEEISASHGIPKKSPPPLQEILLGVKSLSQKLFAFGRLLRIVGQQQGWKFLEPKIEKGWMTYLQNQREWKMNHQASTSTSMLKQD